MKIYGFDSIAVARGEMLAAEAPSQVVNFDGPDQVGDGLGWERAFTSFKAAKRELIIHMVAERCDPEMVRAVQSLKASDVPVTEEVT